MSNLFSLFQTLLFIKKNNAKIMFIMFLFSLFNLLLQMEIICEKKNIYEHILYIIICMYTYIYIRKIFYRDNSNLMSQNVFLLCIYTYISLFTNDVQSIRTRILSIMMELYISLFSPVLFAVWYAMILDTYSHYRFSNCMVQFPWTQRQTLKFLLQFTWNELKNMILLYSSSVRRVCVCRNDIQIGNDIYRNFYRNLFSLIWQHNDT